GIADGLDLQVVQQNMDMTGGLAQGDFDGNGLVNTNDLTLLNNSFQRRMPSASYGRIADRKTAIPGMAANFFQVGAPVIDRAGNVVFNGAGMFNLGMYRWSAGVLSKVVDNGTPAPGGGSFSNVGQPAITGGRVAFQANVGGLDSIFSYSAGTVTKVLSQTTIGPTGTIFGSLGNPLAFGATTVFVSEGAAYAASPNATTIQVLASGTPVPGGRGVFTRIDTPLTDGSNYWFTGQGIGQFGIYKKSGGVLSTLVDQNTPVTGTDAKFTAVGNLSSDGMNLSFTGEFNNASGVFGLFGSTVNKIADTSTKIPGCAGQFSAFGVSSMGGGSVAFVGFDKNRSPGIYAWIGGELNRVIDSGVTLGGKIISSLEMTASAVAGNKVVFQADFTDGSSGIFSASMYPTRVPGDVNNDGKVDAADLSITLKNIGHTGGRSLGDLNGDGQIDIQDFQILEQNFGHTGFAPLLGDATGDGTVNGADMKVLFAHLGKYGGIPQADFDGDGRIDFADFQVLEQNFGKFSAAPYEPFGTMSASDVEVLAGGVVPEPGAMGLLAIGAAGVVAGRRRRRLRAS
ncbi:MAG: hypothetical protein JWN40_863, partial [Phycisphaerales bacterium]|nr:hypothetical protein [Phycisphaerales bacterium]